MDPALRSFLLLFILGKIYKIGTQENNHKHQPVMKGDSCHRRLGKQTELDNAKVHKVENEDNSSSDIIQIRNLHTGHAESNAHDSPKHHNQAVENGETGKNADIGRRLKRRIKSSAVDIGTYENACDKCPQAGECKIGIPEDGTHLVSRTLVEKVASCGTTDKSAEEDKLAALEGQTEVEGSEDAECAQEFALA